ncbi:MAG TPA: hypothetical protein VFA07_09070 [Chthonomonadaceae bacterium]|nr:hypothetical protein [Chthonomonadaceae bacterium]
MVQVTVVNMIPQSLSGETNNDSEPNLTVNPVNPLQMAASAFTPNPAGAGDAPIFVSIDGGNTWFLQTIVPSDQMTADITLRFSGTNHLYAGIIRTPIQQDANGNLHPRLNILRSDNIQSGQKMKVLVDRTGAGVDQPYIQATSKNSGAGAAKDVVIVGDNDFNQPGGRTATMDVSVDAAAARPAFNKIDIDSRKPAIPSADAPSIRPAIHSDGTIYGAFLHTVGGSNLSNILRSVIVVRDDNWTMGANPFTALKDPSDGFAGRILVSNRLIPFLPPQGQPGPIGQERIGSHITIAVDPRPNESGSVYVAWADRVGTDDYTLHVRSSSDRGVTWSPNDLLTITNALNPALAINSDGLIGFLYQQYTGPLSPGIVTASNQWVTHLRLSADGINWNDLVLAQVPANAPSAMISPGVFGLPYLGDYLHLLTINKDFYGIFSANNTPNQSHFPNGVAYQRNHDFNTGRLLDMDGTSLVDISIDPFFFKVTP